MRYTACPHCHESTLIYCPECGHSWRHNAGVTVCQFTPEHDGDRHLACTACGYTADKEGVLDPNGNLIPYPGTLAALYVKQPKKVRITGDIRLGDLTGEPSSSRVVFSENEVCDVNESPTSGQINETWPIAVWLPDHSDYWYLKLYMYEVIE